MDSKTKGLTHYTDDAVWKSLGDDQAYYYVAITELSSIVKIN